MEFVSVIKKNLNVACFLASSEMGFCTAWMKTQRIRKQGPCEWHLQRSHTGKGTFYYDSVSKVWFHQKTGGKRHRQSISGLPISERGKKIITRLHFSWHKAWNTAPCFHTNPVFGGLWAKKPLREGEIRAQSIRQMCLQRFRMKTGRKAEKKN